MPRRRVVAKREILPDPVYGSELIAKFVNCVMRHGKKSLAEQIVYGALEELFARRKKRHKDREEGEGGEGGDGGRINTSLSADLVDLLDETLDKLRPGLEVRSRRVGGATYQIPVEVPAERRTTLAMRWLIDAAKDRGEKTMALRLAAEMGEALEGRGSAMKKREDVHRMAKANQAFAHFRWN